MMERIHLDIQIRDSVEDHLFGLRWWLKETKGIPLEEMSSFFDSRLEDYPYHMERWNEAYRIFPDYLPPNTKDILDLGCGTGLEIDQILTRFPQANITGIDMSSSMLKELSFKHPEVRLIKGNYCDVSFEDKQYDAAVSFESLHHLLPDKKLSLYQKILSALNKNGVLLNCDYFACCDEEEDLLRSVLAEKRKAEAIPDEMVVHFDIPLTLEHEADLLEKAGFRSCIALSSHSGACFLLAKP
ncbi:MAG: class I SAM-dependent methyltransferase [Oscillospiraceae bacterium]|nr:class I SAM-dependent methyltransferase [Oscillospiraceae bacterium]